MNYTEKYHLPQWEETDRIMRVDFNEAMSGIEAGLAANAENTASVKEKVDAPWYAVGGYIGLGTSEVVIKTGFHPRFVLIAPVVNPANASAETIDLQTATVYAVNPNRDAIEFTDEGFRVRGLKYSYPNVNRDRTYYSYLALL